MSKSKTQIKMANLGRKGGASRALDIESAKTILIEQIQKTPPAYTRPEPIARRVANYVSACKREQRPLTETGLRIALDINYETYQNYLAGERDYLVSLDIEARDGNALQELTDNEATNIYNYLIGYNPAVDNSNTDKPVLSLSNVLQKARDLISLEREERLATSGRVAEIFTMKAREGWQDGSEHVTNVLNISAGNAKEALRLLGYREDKTSDNV